MTTEPPNPPDVGGPDQQPPATPPPPPETGGVAEPPAAQPPAEPPAVPPPPPPPPSPVPAAAGGAPFQVGEAFNYGWKKFQEYLGPILVTMVVLFVLAVVINWIGVLLSGGFDSVFDPDDGGFTGLFFSFSYLVYSLISALVGLLIQAAIVRGALAITRGEQIETNTFLAMDNVGQIVLAAVILAVATAIGFVLCIIPGLIIAFFSQFTYHYIINNNMQAVDAIRASFTLVNRNLGSVIGLFFASILAVIVGAILCGVGLIVAIPVTIIATAFAFKKMIGEPVAA